MIKYLPSLAILAVAAGIFAAAPAAHADSLYTSLYVQVWNGTGTTNTSYTANLASKPTGTPLATFDYTGPLNFVNMGNTNNFQNFFTSNGSNMSYISNNDISNFHSTDTWNQFLDTIMSTSGSNQWVNGINTYMSFSGTYTGGGSVTITHDDGASLYTFNGETWSAVSGLYYPSPTSPTASTGTLTSGMNTPFDLVYVEANGAPSVLTTSGLSPVPEPGTIGFMSLGMIGLGALMYRGSAFNS